MKVKAPLDRDLKKEGEERKEKERDKFVPIIFSHGIGNSMSWFSTITKDLAS